MHRNAFGYKPVIKPQDGGVAKEKKEFVAGGGNRSASPVLVGLYLEIRLEPKAIK